MTIKEKNENQLPFSISYSEAPIGKSNHFHEGHQLLYVVSGTVEITVDGQTETVSGGTLLIFHRLTEHSIRVQSAQYQRYSMRILPKGAAEYENDFLISTLFNRVSGFSHTLQGEKRRERTEQLFASLLLEVQSDEPFRSEMLQSLYWELIIHVCRLLPQNAVTENSDALQLVNQIRKAFEENYGEKYTLKTLAEEYHISASHLSHLFKKITGKSLMEYLFACRLLAAKRLLATTNLSVGEIVESCGFSDDSNFSRAFHKRVGVSPSAFRKRYRGA